MSKRARTATGKNRPGQWQARWPGFRACGRSGGQAQCGGTPRRPPFDFSRLAWLVRGPATSCALGVNCRLDSSIDTRGIAAMYVTARARVSASASARVRVRVL
eukprot:6189704-Pleurochrysis_carterae.AAC.3